MDPPPLTAAAGGDLADPFPSAKLRLMCSYGGHIVPRPNDKSLCYAGGDTRIVAVDRRSMAGNLSALTAHLSRALYNNRPFLLKYQLPNEDLDSLISITTDEDLQNMLEEHDRLTSSPKPARIRLFLFPAKPESVGSVLLDPKAESWFCDALKSTKIMQRGQSADSALVNGLMGLDCGAPSDSSVEGQVESLNNSGEARHGLDLCAVPESMVLETSSSFGSTSSSISMSNLPPIGVHGDDSGASLQDKKVKVPSPRSVESDNSIGCTISYPQAAIYQHPAVNVSSGETMVSSSSIESDNIICDRASGPQMVKTTQVPFAHVPLQSEQTQLQQDVRYIQAGVHYMPQYSASPVPVSSYYPVYYPPLHQQAPSTYQPNQPYPVYVLPVRSTQAYNMSMHYNLVDSATTAPSQPQMHQPTPIITPTVAYKEVVAAAPPPELATKVYRAATPPPELATKVYRAATPPPELAANVYRTVAGATPLVYVPPNQNQQPLVDISDMNHPSQPIANDNKYEDDLAYSQIYKTQPSEPAFLSQYQTVTTPGTVQLTEASK
ncbi:uncharacterized protein LOC127803809 [Diospyros lotus]|uniref:uncharacterized protein LOC127803809 n=1 Tax=Diospyros lotus TaxID=55363 RepID=UPI0022572ADE|nr:uncharacterized protein LOC127803809 [Diospyros lotus]